MDYKINKLKLKNGLTVIHVPRPDSKNISISLKVIGGSMIEGNNEIGVAHFLEHIVLDGTIKYPDKKKLSGIIEDNGGVRTASTYKEKIEYSVRVLSEYKEHAFDFLSQTVIYPLISEEDILKEKKVIEQEINRFKSDPEKYSDRQIYSTLYSNSRLGYLNTGDIKDIKPISRENILNYHKRTHCGNNMVICVCGDITLSDTENVVKKYFQNLPDGRRINEIKIVPHITSPKVEYISGIKQDLLTLAYNTFPIKNKESYAIDLVYKVLMATGTSRIRYKIREKMALAYLVRGTNYRGINYGISSFQVGTDSKNVDLCINSIKDELYKITKEIIFDSELEKVYSFIKSNYIFNLENSLNLASFYSDLWCSNENIENVGNILKVYNDIVKDKEYIRQISQKVFSVEPAILIVKPENH